jgi:copper chaperone CopZ
MAAFLEETMKQAKRITIPSISCNHCVLTIQRELGDLPGVSYVQGDTASKTVMIEWSEPPADWSSIKELLTEIGHPPDEPSS